MQCVLMNNDLSVVFDQSKLFSLSVCSGVILVFFHITFEKRIIMSAEVLLNLSLVMLYESAEF